MIRKLGYSNKADTAQFRKTRKLEDRQVCKLDATYTKVSLDYFGDGIMLLTCKINIPQAGARAR